MGGTYDRNGNLMQPTGGYAVGVKECESLDAAFAEAKRASKPLYVGYWRDEGTGKVYYDLVRIVKGEGRAKRVGRSHWQLAIYNFADSCEVRLA